METQLQNLVVEDNRGKCSSVALLALLYLMFELHLPMVRLDEILVSSVLTSSILDANYDMVS